MPSYRLNKKSYVNDMLCEPGTVVDYVGEPGDGYEPLDDAARAAMKAAILRRETSAKVTVIGAEKAGNEELVTLVKSLIDRVAALSMEVSEHEVGLQLLVDRIASLKGNPKRGKATAT